MGGTGVIDRFLGVFTQYIDSGFGLLQPEVAFVATTLIAIDLTLAALFWSWGGDNDIIARLVKKTLFVGVFAYLIGNWNSLARIVFESFSGLGLKAAGSGLSAADFLRPGRVAQVGLDAGRPLLDSISGLMGYISFFENFIQIMVLLFAWVMVLLAFFILAIQLFVTLIEFKLTTLAGFVLIPFGLFGKSAFMAERVLGNVISSGIKVLVLAVIVGIGSTLFSQFTSAATGTQPSIDDTMAMVLAALSLLGLGIFGPGIANGLVSGGPQLGAGAAVGAAAAGGGVVAAGVAGAGMAAGGLAAAVGVAAGAARGGAALAGGVTTAYRAGGASGVATSGLAKGVETVMSPLRRAAGSLKSSFEGGGSRAATGEGSSAGTDAAASASTSAAASSANSSPPPWARRMKRANHEPWDLGRGARRSLRRSRRRRRLRRSFRRGIVYVSKTSGPLRPHAPARDALSESGASLGRAYRLGAGPGEKLAADGIWFTDPVGGLGAQSRLAIIARHRHALGGAGRSPRPGTGDRARDIRLSADRSADRLSPRALHRGYQGIAGRSDRAAPTMVARLRLHHRSRCRRAQRFRPHQRSLCQSRQDADLGRGLQRHPRLAG